MEMSTLIYFVRFHEIVFGKLKVKMLKPSNVNNLYYSNKAN